MILIWTGVFIVSLTLLVKSADWLLESSEKIGLKIGLSPFVVGVVIVGVGTSFPELVSSLFAAFQGTTEIVVANAVGSNIANILLVVGVTALISKKITVTKDLINLDLPLVTLSFFLFLITVYDGVVSLAEGAILTFGLVSYVWFSVVHKEDGDDLDIGKKAAIKPMDSVMLVVGVLGLAIGANYLIESVVTLSALLNIAPGVISITAIAFGTSLPELLVSVKAAFKGKSEVAVGNIIGSNVFNVLGVVGIPALFTTLYVDEKTLMIGIPVLFAATLAFVISGISKRIHIQEGVFFVLIYLLFIVKLFIDF
jgi:cation:H+ antiporter